MGADVACPADVIIIGGLWCERVAVIFNLEPGVAVENTVAVIHFHHDVVSPFLVLITHGIGE